jgi:hypothetical protein
MKLTFISTSIAFGLIAAAAESVGRFQLVNTTHDVLVKDSSSGTPVRETLTLRIDTATGRVWRYTTVLDGTNTWTAWREISEFTPTETTAVERANDALIGAAAYFEGKLLPEETKQLDGAAVKNIQVKASNVLQSFQSKLPLRPQ